MGLVGGAMPVFDPIRHAHQSDTVEKKKREKEDQKITEGLQKEIMNLIFSELKLNGDLRSILNDAITRVTKLDDVEKRFETAVNPNIEDTRDEGEGDSIFTKQDPKADKRYYEIKTRMNEISKDDSLTAEEKKQRIDMYKDEISSMRQKLTIENRIDAGDYYGVRDDIRDYQKKMYDEQREFNKACLEELAELEKKVAELRDTSDNTTTSKAKQALMDEYMQRIEDIETRMSGTSDRVDSVDENVKLKKDMLENKLSARSGFYTNNFDPYHPTEDDIARGARKPDLKKKMATPF